MQRLFKTKFILIPLFLLFWLVAPKATAQKILSGGVINEYAKVLSVNAGDQITVNNASNFSAGDTVLIIQMKGADIINFNTSSFGILQNVNSAGRYEFIIILSVTGNQITFVTNLSNVYDPAGSVQLVRVPGYNNAIVTGDITCQPWDSTSGTGGVLAFMVGGTLTLNADIDVSSKGFAGGIPVSGNGDCGMVDAAYQNYYFSAGTDSAGYKGEGIATNSGTGVPLGTLFNQGRGALYNGGGGGNANMAGGGGGGNMGAGGLGGTESNACVPQQDIGGIGGKDIPSSINWETLNLVFMGGGGGSGTQFGGTTATAGGEGGGIVIIMTGTLVANNYYIRANGNSVAGPVNGSGGGGGAGGSILLSVNSYADSLNVEAKGGSGGSTNGSNCTGAGGGGGGGLIWYAGANAKIRSDVTLGAGGFALAGGCGFESGSDGFDGIVQPGLKLPLTGFLFNTVFSSVTLLQTDTICEGDLSPILVGTEPKGGVSPYTYLWESSNDKLAWNPEPGGNTKDYAPVAPLVDTTYYRRTVQDSPGPVQITDISKEVTIIVQPKIIHDTIFYNDSVCSGLIPDTVFSAPKLPTGGNGPGSYVYLWQEKSTATGNLWVNAQGTNNQYFYLPPVLTTAAITRVDYRRIVSSGIGCPDTITLGILNYLPSITNVIEADQAICDGDQPQSLVTGAGNPVSGGSGSYLYNWLVSTDDISYAAAGGNSESFQPPVLSHGTASTQHWFYKRAITSSTACLDTSGAVNITVYPLILGNTIGRDTTICKGTAPAQLTGTAYSGGAGAGTYSFQWLFSNDDITYSNVPGETSESINPADLSVPTYFKRIITSTFAPNSCIDTSATPIFIDIHPVFNVTISDLATGQDTVCNGSTGMVTLIMSTNAPWDVWLSNDQGWDSTYTGLNASPANIDVRALYSFSGSTPFTTLQYQIDSIKDTFGCNAELISGNGKIVAVRPPVANAGLPLENCGLSTTLNPVLNFGSGIWSGPPEITFTDPAQAQSGVSAIEGSYTLTWTVSSAIKGICPDVADQGLLTLWEPPSPSVILPLNDTTLEAFANDIVLSASFSVPRVGAIKWSLTEGSGTFNNDTAQTVLLENLDWGNNTVELVIRNGTCPDETSSRTITVLEKPFIPVGISPRVTPGQNDFFRIENVGNVPNVLTVFTRGGNVVFRTENFMSSGNFPEGWDGTDMHENPLPDDTYYYILRVEGNHPKTFTGYIVIKGSK